MKKNNTCIKCPSYCCVGYATPITKPRTDREKEDLLWQLQYRAIKVYIKNHRWYILVDSKCMHLKKNNLCRIYDKRPKQCKKHSSDDCEATGQWYDYIFSTPKDLKIYFSKK
ncbi:MAG: YkgJ family cysteine cluster protein [Elusimicrobiota bacterium]